MSTIIMSACWPLDGMSIAQKAVLISLADNANDQGVCWPSIPTIAARVCASERAVQNAIKWLESAKVIAANRSNGRHTSYTVTPAAYSPPQEIHHRTACASEGNAPAQEIHHTPAGNAGVPPQEMHQPPHQVPSNRNKPPKEPSKNRQGARGKKSKAEKIADGFDELWAVYPKKQAKQDAQKAFTKLAPNPELLTILLAAVTAQSAWASWIKDGGEFVPNLGTWLNGRRWEDEAPPPPPARAAAAESAPDWWSTATGIEAKGAEIWRVRRGDELFQQYRVGVFKRAGEGPWRQALLADLLRTKSASYASVHEYFYGHPPVEGQL